VTNNVTTEPSHHSVRLIRAIKYFLLAYFLKILKITNEHFFCQVCRRRSLITRMSVESSAGSILYSATTQLMSQWVGGAAAVQVRLLNSSVTMMESCWTGSQSDAAWTETILSSTSWSSTTLEYICVWRKLDRGFGTSLTWLCQVIRDVYQIGSSSTLTRCCNILANVHVRYLLSSVCRLTSATLVHSIWYLGHPLTSTENFTEIVPGNPSVGRFWTYWTLYLGNGAR